MALPKGTARLGASLSEDGSRAEFRNVVFVANWTMDKVQKKRYVLVDKNWPFIQKEVNTTRTYFAKTKF